ncbi:hypothetical protein T492DRAFT_105913 [Pavlovales sp. CCMP2436]|nr:hypothetical protein T492DRAFT_105913 [Pavlovales sp. CCMP2436]
MVCSLPGCDKPKHVDARTSVTHDFCGRSHVAQYLAQQGRELPPPHGRCHECALPGCYDPVFYESSTGCVHEFCGMSHAHEAISHGLHPRSNRQLQGQASSSSICSLPGCSAPCFVDPDTRISAEYCGRTHAVKARDRGLLPLSAAGLEQEQAG